MLIAKAKDAAFWEKVRTSEEYKPFVDELHALWEKDCVRDIPASKYSEFIIFNVTGSRDEYQSSYFHRRRVMNTSALLSLIYPEEEKYFTKLCDAVWAILDEYTWVLPAHMPSFTENVVDHIDLFAAETGGALSEIDYLLADRLPPLIRNRITYEVQRHIIDGYTGEKRFHWEKNTANWATVCLGSVVMALVYQRPDLIETVRPRIDETVRCYLSGFPEDGICLEGFGYWHYGFGFFVTMADLLYQFSDGKIDYLSIPKVKQIAKYPYRMYLDGRTTVSFSDGGMAGHYHIGLLHYLKQKFPDAVEIPDRSFSYTNDSCGRWCMHLRAFLWFDKDAATTAAASESVDYADRSQWLVKKTSHYGFAAKGGHNAEPHNHNDLGSFIVAHGGEQILCDPGAGRYCKQYFRGERYTFFKASSRGHSVPIIGGQYQVAGREHAAETTYENGVFTVEMHRGYDISALTELKRSFSFTDSTVTVADTFGLTEEMSITERFVSRKPAEITDGTVKTGSLTLKASAGADVTVHEEEGVWCIDYALTPGVRSFTLTVEVDG